MKDRMWYVEVTYAQAGKPFKALMFFLAVDEKEAAHAIDELILQAFSSAANLKVGKPSVCQNQYTVRWPTEKIESLDTPMGTRLDLRQTGLV